MRRLVPSPEDQIFVRRFAIVLIGLALAAFVVRIGDILLLAFGATLGAILLATAADWLAPRIRVSRPIGLVIATMILFAVLSLMGWLFGSETGKQAAQLWQTLPGDWARLRTSLEGSPIGKLFSNSFHQGSQGTRFAHILLEAGWGTAEIVANFLIVVIGAIFFAAQPDIYRKGVVWLAPRPYRPVVGDAIDDVVHSLRLWLLTQLISMTMMGILIGVGLWLSGVQAPAALGLLGGLSEFIPYVGPTLAMIPAVIVALVGQGSIWGVLGTYAIVRIVQVQIITPLISQRMVSVPAGLYLFLILSMGSAFGVFGMFFAGALSVSFYTLVIRIYSREVQGDDIQMPGRGS